MQYTKADIKAEMKKERVTYTCRMRKIDLIRKLAKERDSRYKLWGKTVKQLKKDALLKGVSQKGNKEQLVNALWNYKPKTHKPKAHKPKARVSVCQFLGRRKDIIKKLEDNQVEYNKKDNKETLLDLLVEHVDYKYKLWQMDIDQLTPLAYRVKIASPGNKRLPMIKKLWKKNEAVLRRGIAGFGYVGEHPNAPEHEVDPPIMRPPMESFLKMTTFEELVEEYKELSGYIMVRMDLLDNLEKLTEAVSILRMQDMCEGILRDDKTVLDADTLSVIMSFSDSSDDNNKLRIKMIQEAEYYGGGYNIEAFKETLKEMTFHNTFPEYIDGNSPHLRKTQLHLPGGRGTKMHFAKRFAEYYNKYIRGDISRLRAAYEDLDRKKVLVYSSSPKALKNVSVRWNDALGYTNDNKQKISPVDRMAILDTFRPKIENIECNTIDMSRISQFIDRHTGTFKSEITQADVDNAALLGTCIELRMMTETIHYWNRSGKYSYPDKLGYMPSFAKVMKQGPYAEPGWQGVLGFVGGDYRTAMVKLFGFINDYLVMVGDLKTQNERLLNAIRTISSISSGGVAVE